MLVKIYNAEELQKEFKKRDRDNFSLDGYKAIIEFFEETGEPQKLDVVGIDSEFTEATEEQIREDYTIEGELMDYLTYHTYAQKLKNGNILYIAF